MKKLMKLRGPTTLIFIFILVLNACDRNSSPEGRLEIKLENLHKEMIDSLKKQNTAMLDSLSKIREDLRKIHQPTK